MNRLPLSIGTLGRWMIVAASVFGFVSPGLAAPQRFVQLLESPHPVSEGFYGWDLAASDDVLVVGASKEALGLGNVYVYSRTGPDAAPWELATELVRPPGGGEFGLAIENLGNIFAISGIYGTTLHAGDGLVHLFDLHDPANPVIVQTLYPSVSTQYTRFGQAMRMNSRWLAVSALFGTGPSNRNGGVVYIFENQGGVWVERYRVEADDVELGDHFGYSLALDGDRLLVHSLDAYHQNVETGAAYLFELHSTHAVQIKRFDREHFPSGTGPGSTFPASMHIEHDEILLVDYAYPVVTGSRYTLNHATNAWEWTETSLGLGSVVDYPVGVTPPGAYLSVSGVFGSYYGYGTVHDCRGTWEETGKRVLPPAYLPGFRNATGRVVASGNDLLSGAILYPPPSSSQYASPGSVFIWEMDSDFFDPGPCLTAGDVMCTSDTAQSAAPCLCGGAPPGSKAGCMNSTGNGGRLRGVGDASYAFQDMTLVADQLPPRSPVFLRWALRNGLAPTQAGAGINCLGSAIAGTATGWADAAGLASFKDPDLPLPATAFVGQELVYQAFYRDAPSASCSAAFNVTNGLALGIYP